MLHYNPQHVSSSTLLVFRRTNCIITASGIVTLCKRPYSILVESGLQFAVHPRTIQPVGSRYTNYATRPEYMCIYMCVCVYVFVFVRMYAYE